MVRLGLAKSRNQATVKLITMGIERMRRDGSKKKVKRDGGEVQKREIPYPLPKAKDVDENRE